MTATMENASRALHPFLKAFIDETKTYLKIAMVFSFFINLLFLTVPMYMLQVYDRVLTSRSIDTLLTLTLVAVIALLALSFLDTARAQLVARLGYRLDQRVSPEIVKASLSDALQKSRFPSVQGIRNLGTVRNFLNSTGATALMDLPWMPIFILVIFLLHPILGWLAVAGSVALLMIAWLGEHSNRDSMAALGMKTQGLVQELEGSVRSADAFEAMGISQRWTQRWMNQNLGALRLAATANDRNSVVLSISRFFRMGLQLAVLGVGAYLVLEGEITAGVMIAASILMSRALAPLEQSIGGFKSLVAAKKSFDEINALLEHVPASNVDTFALPKPKGLLQVESITYFHPGATEPCLYGISFSLKPGESLGLIGPSGAGKSTLARLLVGTLAPKLGHVRLDGMDLSQWSASDRGQYVGYLPQTVELTAGTVLENICRLEEPDKEAVIATARLAEVHDLIMRLPQGYDTQIGHQGAALSSGQQQRVALARALYGNISFVLLDEPNAHLDHEGELAVARVLDELREAGITVIVVAHRPLIIQNVDKLLVLKNGRIASFGAREDVMKSLAPVI